jgi:hypothetical protein
MPANPLEAATAASVTDSSRLRWFVPDAYIPPTSTAPELSHESICVLNRHAEAATILITAYFADRQPEQSLPITIPGRRALHLRTDMPDAIGGLRIERGVPYALEIESDTDLQIQYSRLDTTQPAYSLMTALLAGAHVLA